MSVRIFMRGDDAGTARIGAKADALKHLSKHGFKIPPFLVITPEAFCTRGLRKHAEQDLFERLAEIGPGPYAVRSSAQNEDGGEHSHAGQYVSVLNIEAGDLVSACNRVRGSAFAENVSAYRQIRGLDAGGGLAVIVQQMVNARCAGVLFTADPVTASPDRIVMSAVEGLADKLAGGKCDGETYVIDRTGGTLLQGPGDGILTAKDIDLLRKLAIEVEQACASPQDIEWAFDRKELYLLQSRPITAGLTPDLAADAAVTVFDNSNIVESYPGLVSPLTYSFAQYAYARVYANFMRLMGVDEKVIRANAVVFENMLARIDGRIYYNLVNWYRALAMLTGFSINRDHMETMMGVGEPLPEHIAASIGPAPAKGWQLCREWFKLGRVGLRLVYAAFNLERTIGIFNRRLDTALADKSPKPANLSLSDLAAEYRRIEANLLDRWDAPIINDFLCMIAFGGSRKLLEKWVGSRGLEIHNDIMIGQGGIVSAEPARRICKMGKMLSANDGLRNRLAGGDGRCLASHPQLQAAIDSYLDKFADRCVEELKLESVPLNNDPAPLYRAIAAAASTRPIYSGELPKTDPDQALDDVFTGHPVRRFIAGIAVRWAKNRVRDRENLRYQRTRVFGRARAVFKEIGRQFHAAGALNTPNDIFYLTVPEVLGAIEGFEVTSDLRSLADLRKTEMAAARLLPDPPERFLVKGAVLSGANRLSSQAPAISGPAQIRKGVGCSAGRVSAPARTITDPRIQTLRQGEVLVARHTDPGWISAFCNASAIVAERGSLLSHSAIVARELGIPCVVGLKGAMSWIEDGDQVTVDGAAGVVRKSRD